MEEFWQRMSDSTAFHDIYRINPWMSLSYTHLLVPSPSHHILYTDKSRFMWMSFETVSQRHQYGKLREFRLTDVIHQCIVIWICERNMKNQVNMFFFVDPSVHVDLLPLRFISIFDPLKLHHSDAIRNLVDCHVPAQKGVITQNVGWKSNNQ